MTCYMMAVYIVAILVWGVNSLGDEHLDIV